MERLQKKIANSGLCSGEKQKSGLKKVESVKEK